MDSAPYSINESSSVKRCYRFFRTMGLRHLVVVDAFHKVTGMITRNDVTQHRMQTHWAKGVSAAHCRLDFISLIVSHINSSKIHSTHLRSTSYTSQCKRFHPHPLDNRVTTCRSSLVSIQSWNLLRSPILCPAARTKYPLEIRRET